MVKENNKKEPILLRLDVIIALLTNIVFQKDGKIQFGESVKYLKTLGMEPKEIANLFGKLNATEISTYLYGKKNK